MKLKFKKLNEKAVIPSYASVGDAGLDLTAVSLRITPEYFEYGTGLAVQIPDGHAGFLFPRSSVSKKNLSLANSIGVIDAGYRGEVKLRFRTAGLENGDFYEAGDRIGQLVILPIPKIEPIEVAELDESDRGEGGFGSTGR